MRDIGRKRGLTYLVKTLIIVTIIVFALGYFDFITGEISIDILYVFCICLVTWYTNTLFGILCVIEVIFAKTTADYFDRVRVVSHLYEWATFNNIVIYIIVCLLTGKVKKELSK